ncbi:hypothetical protein MASR2M39_00100 [Ignavibacteriales bacterium]
MSLVSFVIFIVVAFVTILFSLFLAFILSRRKSSNFETSSENQSLRYATEENHNQSFRSNIRITDFDDSDNFVTDRGDRQIAGVRNNDFVYDPSSYLSKRNFTVAGSRVVSIEPSRIVEPVEYREIRLQFK